MDLYRVEQFRDLETLGIEDVLSDPAVIIIEWAERFALHSEWPRLLVRLEHLEGDTRRITISEVRLPKSRTCRPAARETMLSPFFPFAMDGPASY